MAAGGGLGRFRWTYTSPAILERFPNALGEHDKKITTFDIDKANGTLPKINGDALVASAPPLCNSCTASHSSDFGILAALTGCDTKSVDKQSDKQQATLCNDSMRLRGAGGESTDDLAALGRLSNNDNELFFRIMRKVHYIHQRDGIRIRYILAKHSLTEINEMVPDNAVQLGTDIFPYDNDEDEYTDEYDDAHYSVLDEYGEAYDYEGVVTEWHEDGFLIEQIIATSEGVQQSESGYEDSIWCDAECTNTEGHNEANEAIALHERVRFNIEESQGEWIAYNVGHEFSTTWRSHERDVHRRF